MSAVDAAPQNEAQQKLLEVVERWRDTYNEDVEDFVQVYAPDAHIRFPGGEACGHEQFRKIERAVADACPTRRLRVDTVRFSSEETAIVEGVLLDEKRPDYCSPYCCILTARDGRIVEDRAYLNPNDWPGLVAAAPHVTPGGLGRSN